MKATELPSYWATSMKLNHHNCRAERVKSRKIPMKKIGWMKATELPSYWATSMKNNFRRKRKVTKLLSWATELPSYQATKLPYEKIPEFFFKEDTELPSYWDIKLLSYRHEKKFGNFFSKEKIKLPSYLPTELPGPKKISGRKKLPSYWAKLLSYRATKLPSYWDTSMKKISKIFFSKGENKATKLPSFPAEENY